MTLTQTALLTKQVIAVTLVTSILGIFSFIGYKMWYAYYLSTLPPVEEKPDIKFGILPTPNFPSSSVSSSNYSYSLDTTTGSLPTLGDNGFEKIIKVYFIIKPFATFLSPDRSQALAARFNIKTQPEILTETRYLFEENKKKLTVDLDNGNFTYIREATPSGDEKLEDDKTLTSGFENILGNLGVLKPQLTEGRFKIIPLKVAGNQFIFSEVRTEASLAQISLWPKAINDKSIFTSDFEKSQINATIIGSSSDLDNYMQLNFTFWQIDENTFATYPTKSPSDALVDLQSGKGVVILEPDKPQVSITSVYLGYFLSDNYNQYLHPIYVFEGPKFAGYVSALTPQFIEQARLPDGQAK